MTDDVVLELSLRGDARANVVSARGEIDVRTGPVLRAAILALPEGDEGVLLDLSEVSFVDSSGLSALTDVWQACRSADRPFTIQGPLQPSVQKLLRLTALDQVLTITTGKDGH